MICTLLLIYTKLLLVQSSLLPLQSFEAAAFANSPTDAPLRINTIDMSTANCFANHLRRSTATSESTPSSEISVSEDSGASAFSFSLARIFSMRQAAIASAFSSRLVAAATRSLAD